MPNGDNAQGSLAIIGGASAIAGIGIIQGDAIPLVHGLILLGVGMAALGARAWLRFISGKAPE